MGTVNRKAQFEKLIWLLGAHGVFSAVKEPLTGLKDVHCVGVHEIPTQVGTGETIRDPADPEVRHHRVRLVINEQYKGNMEKSKQLF